MVRGGEGPEGAKDQYSPVELQLPGGGGGTLNPTT